MKNDIQIKRVYEPPKSRDGLRVLVDRVWPRGLTKERAHVDLRLAAVAPSTALRKWFNHDPEKWKTFKSRYFSELDANREALATLREAAAKGRVTLLYSARDLEHNQAVALQEYLRSPRAVRA